MPETDVNLYTAIRSMTRSTKAKHERRTMKPFERITNPREIRRRLHLNQQEFWSRIGVTQSGGSRYESGRSMPKPVRELLRLVHIEGIELEKARGADFEIVSYLKRANPKLFQSLRKAASGRTAAPAGRVASAAPVRAHRASRLTRKR